MIFRSRRLKREQGLGLNLCLFLMLNLKRTRLFKNAAKHNPTTTTTTATFSTFSDVLHLFIFL